MSAVLVGCVLFRRSCRDETIHAGDDLLLTVGRDGRAMTVSGCQSSPGVEIAARYKAVRTPGGLSGSLDRAPYGRKEATAAVAAMLGAGTTHLRMNRIARDLVRSYAPGEWPDDTIGQSYVHETAGGLDAWMGTMVYECRGIEFALHSAGPDGYWHTGDDLALWVFHDASREFFPSWKNGSYTTGLNAVSGQLQP